MKRFTELFTALDGTTRTSVKLRVLESYFADAEPADAAWALFFLSGRRPKRAIPARRLLEWAAAASGVPQWLAEESYFAVGDLAETVALLLPETTAATGLPLHRVVADFIEPLPAAAEPEKRSLMERAWPEMDARQRLVFHKLVTGAFRVGVAQTLVSRALAAVAHVEPGVMAHRLMGEWQPTAADYLRLLSGDGLSDDAARPYPFFLAHAVDDPAELGDIGDWQVEWKWDGIRAQLIRRGGRIVLWSRGEELLTERFPEITEAARRLPDGVVLDGEILCWRAESVLPFAVLQRRIGRRSPGPRILAEAPAIFLAFDLLEHDAADLRGETLADRRALLESVIAHAGVSPLRVSPTVPTNDWETLRSLREQSRERGVEGFMLKRAASRYGVGRKRGDWWKWKVEPYSVDAVLVYAQRGHGRRASLYTDYTFAVWDGDELVPFAKAYSGLTDAEIRKVDRFVRHHTLERFGPVRRVEPRLVFELAFEGIQLSTRHRSGVAVRFPRMARWRTDKQPRDADTLDTVRSLIRETTADASSSAQFDVASLLDGGGTA
jgi:DNA ligase 1